MRGSSMSRKADKLWQRAQNTKAGWTERELVRLYEGFGFNIRQAKGSHKVVSHPKYDDLDATIAGHKGKDLPKSYIDDAVKNISTLIDREKKETEDIDEGTNDE